MQEAIGVWLHDPLCERPCAKEFAQDMYVHAMSLVLDTTDEKHRRDMVAAMDDLLYSAEVLPMAPDHLFDVLQTLSKS
eukprot:3970788-Amphidinium_carterae.1